MTELGEESLRELPCELALEDRRPDRDAKDLSKGASERVKAWKAICSGSSARQRRRKRGTNGVRLLLGPERSEDGESCCGVEDSETDSEDDGAASLISSEWKRRGEDALACPRSFG